MKFRDYFVSYRILSHNVVTGDVVSAVSPARARVALMAKWKNHRVDVSNREILTVTLASKHFGVRFTS